MSTESVASVAPVRRVRRRPRAWVVALWVGAAATVLTTVAGAGMSVATIGMAQDLPRTLVVRYLTALEHGHAEQAMKLAGIHHAAGDLLLTDAAYAKATGRVSSFTVARPVTRGTATTVNARIVLGDRAQNRTFSFTRTGGIPGVPLWRMAGVAADTVSFSVAAPQGLTYSIAGITPEKQTPGTTVTFRALPGTYPMRFTSPSSDYQIRDADVTSTPSGTTSTRHFTAQLSSEGDTAARQAIDAWLDACVASPDVAPAGCPFLAEASTSDGLTVGTVHWTLETRPSATVDPAWAHGGWMVAADGGRVTGSATLTRSSDGATGEGTTDPIDFGYVGVVTFGPGGAVFTPSLDDGSAQG